MARGGNRQVVEIDDHFRPSTQAPDAGCKNQEAKDKTHERLSSKRQEVRLPTSDDQPDATK
jgi:hypothetical protein